jgi:hypothetical protein
LFILVDVLQSSELHGSTHLFYNLQCLTPWLPSNHDSGGNRLLLHGGSDMLHPSGSDLLLHVVYDRLFLGSSDLLLHATDNLQLPAGHDLLHLLHIVLGFFVFFRIQNVELVGLVESHPDPTSSASYPTASPSDPNNAQMLPGGR